jgi:hypothetical protein
MEPKGVQKRLLLVPVLGQMNTVHTFPSYFPKVHSNIIFPYKVT